MNALYERGVFTDDQSHEKSPRSGHNRAWPGRNLAGGWLSATSRGVSGSDRSSFSVSRKIYPSAEAMAADADLIVQGRLEKVLARTVDTGGRPTPP